MNIVFSVPTGYHLRELLLPLKDILESSADITEVHCITPAAPFKNTLFTNFSPKFHFWENGADEAATAELLKRIQPHLVITDTVGHDEKDYPILMAAKALHIRTLTFIASWDNVWKIERLVKQPNKVALADHFIVWNHMMREHMMRLFPHLNHAAIAVVGAPRLDFFSHHDKIPNKESLYATLGLSDVSRPLIHLSTTELYPMEYVAQALHTAIEKKQITTQPYLLATVHPGGNLAKHETLKKYGVVVRYAFGRHADAPHPAFTFNPTMAEIYNSVALFTHTSLLINHSSTTALESLVADVPVINIKYGQPLDWWRWYRSMVYRDFQQHYRDVVSDGATRVVGSANQLVAASETYLKNPTLDHEQRAATLKKMITTTDGTASVKVFAIIKQQATLT